MGYFKVLIFFSECSIGNKHRVITILKQDGNTQATIDTKFTVLREGAQHARMRVWRRSKAIYQHSQTSHLWILVFTRLISISPNFCSGAYKQTI